ncbi:hypothetical protein OHW21_07215 [Acinetobacter baumannii]|nr:hypothetical protein [Acinetobacter baumannii]MDC5035216.1 hypothetical protein [Acinetobacter baumannii]MDC5228755.1 hypothetical protein [Acinetobacter baumannii]MDV7369257.1 hypothetical protein [Acinetobacter baumannii]
MLERDEKLKLICELISAGVTDATTIVAQIKYIEEKLFSKDQSLKR